MSQAKTGICFHYDTDKITFPTEFWIFLNFSAASCESTRWPVVSDGNPVDPSTHTLHLSHRGWRTPFHFPEFLHYPIRCALPAHDDDLGLFMFAHLNIYFSAQGEAEKKNVWGRDSTPAPRLLPTPLTFTRRPVTAPEESWDTQWSRWRASGFCEFARGSAARSSLIAEFMPPFFMAAHCFDPVPLFNDP